MRTFETGKTAVEVIAWPKNRRWDARYQTTSSIERGICKIVLSNEVFHDPVKANTAYRRFARRMSKEGLNPPSIEFRNMVSNASKNIFCILTAKESIFNSSCEIGQMYLIESGKEQSRRVCAILTGKNTATEVETI